MASQRDRGMSARRGKLITIPRGSWMCSGRFVGKQEFDLQLLSNRVNWRFHHHGLAAGT